MTSPAQDRSKVCRQSDRSHCGRRFISKIKEINSGFKDCQCGNSRHQEDQSDHCDRNSRSDDIIINLSCKTLCISFVFQYTENRQQSIAIVVVLTPPAVPAGDPPMNISIQPKSFELSLKSPCGTVANPAVLVVTD